LKEKYSETFMERKDWDTFNDRPSDKDAEEYRKTILQDGKNSLGALVWDVHEPAQKSSSGYTSRDDEKIIKVVNDGNNPKRKKEQTIEPVEQKSTNRVLQFDQRIFVINDMVKSPTAIMQPDRASVAPTCRPSATASSSDLDPIATNTNATTTSQPNRPHCHHRHYCHHSTFATIAVA
jgi:hypothetical protein